MYYSMLDTNICPQYILQNKIIIIVSINIYILLYIYCDTILITIDPR